MTLKVKHKENDEAVNKTELDKLASENGLDENYRILFSADCEVILTDDSGKMTTLDPEIYGVYPLYDHSDDKCGSSIIGIKFKSTMKKLGERNGKTPEEVRQSMIRIFKGTETPQMAKNRFLEEYTESDWKMITPVLNKIHMIYRNYIELVPVNDEDKIKRLKR